MKNIFKSSILAVALTAGVFAGSHAQDLIVEENGVAPNFATIQAAVTAALPGQRIFVKNKAGNVPYTENVTINKSLSLLAYDPDNVFYTFGNYTLNPVANGEINIIGMYNNSGGITASAISANGTPTRVNVMNSTFVLGGINLNQVGFVAHIAGNVLMNGTVSVKYATVTGNQVHGSIVINDVGGAVTGYPEDTLYVVGNRLYTTAVGFSSGRIQWSNDDDYFFIANNDVLFDGSGILCNAYKSGGGVNNIENNTIENSCNYNHGAIQLDGTIAAGVTVRVRNNALFDNCTSDPPCCGNTEYAIQSVTPAAGSFVSFDYNVHRNFGNGFTNQAATAVSMTGNQAGGASFNPTDASGECTAPECVDDGSPSTDYTDLNLTRNDVGTAGGSYSHTNFWPNQTGGARVYLVKTPRTVVSSSTINAKADSYDR